MEYDPGNSIPIRPGRTLYRQIAETMRTKGLQENATAGKKGGSIAKKARVELEEATGQKVVTGESFLPAAVEKGLE